MEQAPKSEYWEAEKLTANTWVRLGTAIICTVFLIGFIAAEAKFRTNLLRDVRDLQKEIAKLVKQNENQHIPTKFEMIRDRLRELETTGVADRFHAQEMRLWILETEKLNPNWKGAPLHGDD